MHKADRKVINRETFLHELKGSTLVEKPKLTNVFGLETVSVFTKHSF